MFIHILKDITTTSHTLKKGMTVDVRAVDAERLLDLKYAEKVGTPKTESKKKKGSKDG